MKPMAIRPRKFKVEFEELGDGKAKMRYEEEFTSEELVKHIPLPTKLVEGERLGHDGNRAWIEFEGERGRAIHALSLEIAIQAVENERDALDLIRDISSNALIGLFPISEDQARKIAEEPPNLENIPEEFREMSIGEIIEEVAKLGAERILGGYIGLMSLRQMITEGIIDKDDKVIEALPKIYEYRKRIMKAEK